MSDVAFNSAGPPSQRLTERRRGPRQLTLMRVGLLHARDGAEFCLVRNLSAEGLMATVYRASAQGEDVRMELATGHVLAGHVVWAQGFDIGVKFVTSVDVDRVLSNWSGSKSERRPRPPRLDISCSATARSGARLFAVRLGNISQRGAKILSSVPMPAAASIVLGLPGLPPIHATVRWSSGNEAGLCFNASLSFTALARWVEARRQLERGWGSGCDASPDTGWTKQ